MERLIALIGTLIFSVAQVSWAQFTGDIYMKVDGIEGSAVVSDYDGWSVVRALSGDFSENECGAFMIEKPLDKASVKYAEKAYTGTIVDYVIIASREISAAGDGSFYEAVRIRIDSAKLLSVNTSKEEGSRLTEYIKIAGNQITYTFNDEGLALDQSIFDCQKVK